MIIKNGKISISPCYTINKKNSKTINIWAGNSNYKTIFSIDMTPEDFLWAIRGETIDCDIEICNDNLGE